MRIRSGISYHIVYSCVALLIWMTGTAGSEIHRKQVLSWFPVVPMELKPTLASPVLFREPEYSWGLSNTLYWSSNSVVSSLNPLGLTLLFFEIQASYDGNELWGFVEAEVDSARFTDLLEGISIEYKLRYYARNASGTYLLSHWSVPQTSVQDNHPPILKQWQLVGLQKTLSGNWVIGKSVSIHFEALDTVGGKIMEAVVREVGPSGDKTIHYDFQRPKAQIDTTIPYLVQAPVSRETEIRFWVKDVSGQPSEVSALSFFCWPLEDQNMKMVCFPNPFNPERDQISTIKLNTSGYTLARIFDPFGNPVRVLRKQIDDLFFEWNGRNDRGETVANGAYLCVLDANQRVYCKLVVLK